MKDGSITLGGPGDLFIKTITVQKKGKASMYGVTPWSVLPQPSICLECMIHAAEQGAMTLERQ